MVWWSPRHREQAPTLLPLRHSYFQRRRSRPGELPGTLVVDPQSPPPRLSLFTYGPDEVHEIANLKPEQLGELNVKHPVTWLNVEGLGDIDIIRSLGKHFGLHQLALEDVVNVHQRPKLDEYPEALFIVVRMAYLHDQHLSTEQVSFFLGEDYVLSFQEGLPGDCFDPLRQRIRADLGRIRKAGPDYLFYSLLDGIVDHYFPILENYGERLEQLEDQIITRPQSGMIHQLYAIRRELLTLRRIIWPLRDVVNTLLRDHPRLGDGIQVYLRDCYDHVVQLMDLIETYRDLTSNLMEVYLSTTGNRMNEIMKFLTILTAFFSPLTLIAGIYGMNFRTDVSPWNMPELNWVYGYPFSLLLMASTVLGLLIFFRAKGWLGLPPGEPPAYKK
jgi:magnesium transporter